MEAKRFILSDESVNTYGFSIDMDRLDLERFKSNPVMLYNHGELIGRWSDIKLEDGKLSAVPEFIEDESEQTALKVKKRVEKGFLKGASLGIRVLEVIQSENKPPRVIAEVLEASIVDIPANKNAIALYDKEGKKMEGEALQLTLNQIKTTTSKINKMNKIRLNDSLAEKTGVPVELSIPEVEKLLMELFEKNQQLEKQLKALEEEKINNLIEWAFREGRIDAGQKEKFKKLAQKDFDLAKSTLESLPKAERLPQSEKRSSNVLPDDRRNWTFEDWRKKDTPGLLRIKKEDPDLYNKIINS